MAEKFFDIQQFSDGYNKIDFDQSYNGCVCRGTDKNDSIRNGYYETIYEYPNGPSHPVYSGTRTGYGAICCTIDGGLGDDTISNRMNSVYIKGGSGNDIIIIPNSSNAGSVTVNGGIGDDNIVGNVEVIEYSTGDGNDTVRASFKKIKLIDNGIESASLNDSDVVIKIGFGSMTLKNAKDKEITVIDSEGKEIKFTNTYNPGSSNTSTSTTKTDTTTSTTKTDTTTNSEITKYQTIENLKPISKKNIDVLKKLVSVCDSITNVFDGILSFTGSLFDNDTIKFLKSLNGIIKSSANIAQTMIDNPKAANIGSAFGSLVSDIVSLVDETIKDSTPTNQILKTKKTLKDCILPIASAALSVVASALGGIDGLDSKEREKLIKSVGSLGTETLGAVYRNSTKSAPFGPVDLIVSIVVGVLDGWMSHSESLEKYKNDGLPNNKANIEALIDTFAKGFYEALNNYFQGMDDVVWGVVHNTVNGILSLLGGKKIEYNGSPKNYAEQAAEALKRINIGNRGFEGNDVLESKKNNEMMYGDVGNDSIGVNHTKVSVYGGTGNDKIFIYSGKTDNYVYSGDGNDEINISSNNNIAYGANDKDYIKIFNSSGNKVYGGNGDDVFTITDSSKNTISGDEGNDTIILSPQSNGNVIFYGTDSGNDTVMGYGDNDSIQLGRNIKSYSTVASGNDVIINVDGYKITLEDAKGKKLNISKDTAPSKDDMNVLNIKKSNTSVISASRDYLMSGTSLKLSESHDGNFIANGSSEFKNVKIIDGKSISKNKIIVGNSNSNSIIGGSGQNSLWGGGQGNNTLTGGSSRDKFWHTGGGNEIVTNFVAGSGSTSDVIVLQAKNYSGISRSGKTVSFNQTNGNSMKINTDSSSGDSVFLYSTDGKKVFGAKIGGSSDKSLTYTGDANYYQLNGGGTLNVATGGNTVVLNGNFVGINNIEATGSGSNILVGNNNSNSVTGGSGNSSLWGSAANANDTLVGGNGSDMFWYGRGEGNDVITNSTEKDSVNFYNLKLSDISSIDYSTKSVAISFNSGQKVTVNDSGGTSAVMMFEGGQRWKYNHSSGNWQQG